MRRSVRAGDETLAYTLMQTGRSSIELRVLPTEIRLFTPAACPLRQADAYVASHIDWIREAQKRFEAYADRERAAFPMTDGMPVPLEGEIHTLRLRPAARQSEAIESGEIIISGGDLNPESVAERLRACLVRRAMQRLSERVEHYAPLIGRRPGRVTVRDQRTKWGSCSTLGNVNFNWKLIMAPKEALDYVVIHELCHLYEFNHSDKFWQRVGRYQRDYAHWRDFLRSGWNHPFR